MAKHECYLTGEFKEILAICVEAAMDWDYTSDYEGGSYFEKDGFRAVVRVFSYSIPERHRTRNRPTPLKKVSLTLTLIGLGGKEFLLSAITSDHEETLFKPYSFIHCNEYYLDMFLRSLRVYAARGRLKYRSNQ